MDNASLTLYSPGGFPQLFLMNSGGGASWYVKQDNTGVAIYEAGGTGRLFIEDGGEVMIGAGSPAYKLDVSGQVNASSGLCIAGDCKTAWSQVSSGPAMNSGMTTGTPISDTVSTSTVITHGLSVVPKIINVTTITNNGGKGESWGYAATDGVSSVTSQNALAGNFDYPSLAPPLRLQSGVIAAACYSGCTGATITAVNSTSFTITFPPASFSGNAGTPTFLWEVFR